MKKTPNPEEEPEDLFRWGRGEEGKARRDEGTGRVLSNAKWWRENAYRLIREQPAQVREPFLPEDFWAYALPIIGPPHSYRAQGAVWLWAIKWGWVIATGEERQCRKPTNNANRRRLYRWPLGEGGLMSSK